MNEAISIFYQMFQATVNWVFNTAVISGSDVTLGWVLVSIWLFGLLIRNILNIPRASTKYIGHAPKLDDIYNPRSDPNESWRDYI